MVEIKPLSADYEEYLRDESRTVGSAQSISFPRTEQEVREVLSQMSDAGVPVTVQGGRTGLAAGAVPDGGHVLNLSKMTRCVGLSPARADGSGAIDPDGAFLLTVEPGVVLSQLRKDIEDKNVDVRGWDEASLAAWRALCDAREHFFPTDPTETSATIGGMAACNASGARSYGYGPMRSHVTALRVVLSDGQTLALRRGQAVARGTSLDLVTEQGGHVHVDLPTYKMPRTKNASGYFCAPDMDAVDLFIGSDSTLGVITQIELELVALPRVIWGVSCFFADESHAVEFTRSARAALRDAKAIEYFDADALDILRAQRRASTAFAALPELRDDARACVYVELQCEAEAEATEELWKLGDVLTSSGGSEDATWVARTAVDRETQRFFRHAVPESVNMLIDERRKSDPTITKLGSDMSVPDECLPAVMRMYRETLAEQGLQSAMWGHIGNNHLHVNVLPRDAGDYARGKELFNRWARSVTEMGGAVSAEHGVGKMKRDFLRTMYGERHIREMARVKAQLDPAHILGLGNLFPPDTLPLPVGSEAAGHATDDGTREA